MIKKQDQLLCHNLKYLWDFHKIDHLILIKMFMLAFSFMYSKLESNKHCHFLVCVHKAFAEDKDSSGYGYTGRALVDDTT